MSVQPVSADRTDYVRRALPIAPIRDPRTRPVGVARGGRVNEVCVPRKKGAGNHLRIGAGLQVPLWIRMPGVATVKPPTLECGNHSVRRWTVHVSWIYSGNGVAGTDMNTHWGVVGAAEDEAALDCLGVGSRKGNGSPGYRICSEDRHHQVVAWRDDQPVRDCLQVGESIRDRFCEEEVS
jgi:hypothetical protein